jgi:hypothetical protein
MRTIGDLNLSVRIDSPNLASTEERDVITGILSFKTVIVRLVGYDTYSVFCTVATGTRPNN